MQSSEANIHRGHGAIVATGLARPSVPRSIQAEISIVWQSTYALGTISDTVGEGPVRVICRRPPSA